MGNIKRNVLMCGVTAAACFGITAGVAISTGNWDNYVSAIKNSPKIIAHTVKHLGADEPYIISGSVSTEKGRQQIMDDDRVSPELKRMANKRSSGPGW